MKQAFKSTAAVWQQVHTMVNIADWKESDWTITSFFVCLFVSVVSCSPNLCVSSAVTGDKLLDLLKCHQHTSAYILLRLRVPFQSKLVAHFSVLQVTVIDLGKTIQNGHAGSSESAEKSIRNMISSLLLSFIQRKHAPTCLRMHQMNPDLPTALEYECNSLNTTNCFQVKPA